MLLKININIFNKDVNAVSICDMEKDMPIIKMISMEVGSVGQTGGACSVDIGRSN